VRYTFILSIVDKNAEGDHGRCLNKKHHIPISGTNKLTAMGDTVSDSDQTYALFPGLPAQYDATVSSLRTRSDVTFNAACEHVKNTYETQKLQHSTIRDSAHLVNIKKTFLCAIYNKTNHSTERCSYNGLTYANNNKSDSHINNNTPQSSKPLRCFNCGGVGHILNSCPSAKQEHAHAATQEIKQNNFIG
jgi:hypothetical protein